MKFSPTFFTFVKINAFTFVAYTLFNYFTFHYFISLQCLYTSYLRLCFSIQQFIYLKKRNEDYLVRDCPYEGELARLDWLARLGEISPSLKNSF